MGWLFTPFSTRRSLIAERKESWERSHKTGVGTVKTTCLAACYRGNCYSGVLWAVWERTFEGRDKPEPTERWITCDLLRYSRTDDGWGYKDMDESVGPCYYSCPLGYLKMVPTDQVGVNPGWRKEVNAYHDRLKAKRLAKVTH